MPYSDAPSTSKDEVIPESDCAPQAQATSHPGSSSARWPPGNSLLSNVLGRWRDISASGSRTELLRRSISSLSSALGSAHSIVSGDLASPQTMKTPRLTSVGVGDTLVAVETTTQEKDFPADDDAGEDELVNPFDHLSSPTLSTKYWPIMTEEARAKVPLLQYNAGVMLRQAVDMCNIMRTFESPNPSWGPMKVRIGLHSGDVVGGIIGSKSFRYDVFGVDVLLTNAIEAAGRPGAILLSEKTRDALQALSRSSFAVPGLSFVPRKELVERRGCKPLKAYFAVIPGELEPLPLDD